MKRNALLKLAMGFFIALLVLGPDYSVAVRAPDSGINSDSESQPAAMANGTKYVKARFGLIPVRERGLKEAITGDLGEASIEVAKKLIGQLESRPAKVRKGPESKDAVFSAAVEKILADKQGNRHVRLAQQYKGLSVVGAELVVHADKGNVIYQINGRYLPAIDISVEPEIDKGDALQIGLDEQAGKPGMHVSKAPELVIYALRLAYFYVISHEGVDPGQWIYYVDAQTGSIMNRYNNIQHAAPSCVTGSTTAIDGNRLTGEDGVIVTMEGWKETSGNYYMYNCDGDLWGVYDTDVFDWEQNPTSHWGTADRAAVSCGDNFESTQDFVFNWIGYNSFDNAGAFARCNAHEGNNYVNAYWDGTDFHFGDGDGSTAAPLTVLDIVAHEYGHALTQYSSNLVYAYESGALNEAYSDIFGAFVEIYTQPDGTSYYPASQPGYSDWLMGEDCWLAGEALRNLRDPMSYAYPSYYHGTHWYYGTGDNGGVHTNCCPLEFAFYLLAEGGTGSNDGHAYSITGIGSNNAAIVALAANLNYHTSTDKYEEAREAWIDAATDYGFDVQTVKDVFDAIGVSDSCEPIPDLINDGSFENGPPPASAWNMTANPADCNGLWILDPTGYLGIPAYHCDYVYWAGGYCGGYPSTDSVEQSINIPADAATLKFQTCFYRPDADDVDPDVFTVSIDGTPVFTREMIQANETYPNWAEQVIDISAYAGQSVTLRFEAESTGDLTGNVLVDAIIIGSEQEGCIEDFSDPLGDWLNGCFYQNSNAENYYTATGSNCDPNYRGNQPDGLWISDDRGCGNLVSQSPVRINILNNFGDDAVLFSLDQFTCVTGVTFNIYDKDAQLVVSQALPSDCFNWSNYSYELINGISAFEWSYTGNQVVEGNTSIDNVTIIKESSGKAPDIDVAPTSLAVNINEGDTQVLTLDVANIGDADLVVSNICDDEVECVTVKNATVPENIPLLSKFSETVKALGLNADADVNGDVIMQCSAGVPTTFLMGLHYVPTANVLYVVSEDYSNLIYKMDESCDVTGTLPGPSAEMNGVTFDGVNLWVTDYIGADGISDWIYKLDPATGAVLDSWDVRPQGFDGILGIAWDGQNLWAVSIWNQTIFKLDTNCNVVDSFIVSWLPSGLDWDGEYLVSVDFDSDTIYRVSTYGDVVGSMPAPAATGNSMGVTCGTEGLWFSEFYNNILYLMECDWCGGVPCENDAVWLSQSPTSGTVSPGESMTVDVTFDATGMSSGTHCAVIHIMSNDPDEGIVHIPVTMNIISVAQPDLVVLSIETVPVNPDAGEVVNVYVTVKNEASVAASGFRIDWYADLALPPTLFQDGDANKHVSSLPAGATHTMNTTYTYSTTGTYNMYAQVDTYQEVTEFNEYNNVLGPVSILVGFCECDLNHDGRCDMEDWLIFGEDWGRTDCPIP